MSDPWAAFNPQPAPRQPAADPWAAFNPQAPRAPSTARQIAGNVAGAAARGVSNLVGLPGDIAQGIDRGAQWLARQVGIDASRPAPPPGYEWLPDLSSGVTSGMLREGMRDAGVPVDQRAETAGGRIVQDAVEGAASAPFGAASAIYGAISGGAGGAAAEGVRALEGGPLAQTAARVAGNVLAPMAVGRIASGVQTRRAFNDLPTTEEVQAASQAAYQAADRAGVVIQPGAFAQGMLEVSRAAADGKRWVPGLAPQADLILSEFRKSITSTPMTLTEVDNIRKLIGGALRNNPSPNDGRVLRDMQAAFDGWLANLKPTDVISGGSSAAVESLRTARRLWGQQLRATTLENLMARAELTAKNFTQSGMENALRREFRTLALNPNRMRAFNDAEQEAIRAVAKGDLIGNMWRALGRFAPRGPISGPVTAAAAASLGGAPTAFGLTAAGELGRQMATGRTYLAAQRAAALARTGVNVMPPRVPWPAYAAGAMVGPRALLPQE